MSIATEIEPVIPPLRIPRTLGSAAEEVVGARDDPARLFKRFYASSVPMVLVDDSRGYVSANLPALLAFRIRIAQLRARGMDDLTPAHRVPALKALWARLIERGSATGRYDLIYPDGTTCRLVLYARADILDGRHLIAFVPEGWRDSELTAAEDCPPNRRSLLTPREVELLQLAAQGRSGPRIAEELTLSPATVKTHFMNAYAKLGVRDRSAAIAKAMRLGMIE